MISLAPILRSKQVLLLILVIVVFPSHSVQAGKGELTVEAWLKKRYGQLAAIAEPAKVKASKLNQSKDKDRDGFYSMYPEKGIVKFGDGSWVLLTSHSAHAEDGLPDVSLIRTSTGKFYYNRGHCCLPILLFSLKRIKSLQDFLQTHGKGGEGAITKCIQYGPALDGTRQSDAESKSEGNENPKQDSEVRSE